MEPTAVQVERVAHGAALVERFRLPRVTSSRSLLVGLVETVPIALRTLVAERAAVVNFPEWKVAQVVRRATLEAPVVAAAVVAQPLLRRTTRGCSWQVARVAVQATAIRQPERVIPGLVVRPFQEIKAVRDNTGTRARIQMMAVVAVVAVVAISPGLVDRHSTLTSPGGNAKDTAVTVARTTSSQVRRARPIRPRLRTQVKSPSRTRCRRQRPPILIRRAIRARARLTMSRTTQLQRSPVLQLAARRSSSKSMVRIQVAVVRRTRRLVHGHVRRQRLRAPRRPTQSLPFRH